MLLCLCIGVFHNFIVGGRPKVLMLAFLSTDHLKVLCIMQKKASVMEVGTAVSWALSGPEQVMSLLALNPSSVGL